MKLDLTNIIIEKIPEHEGGGYCAIHKPDNMCGDGDTVGNAIENLIELLVSRQGYNGI